MCASKLRWVYSNLKLSHEHRLHLIDFTLDSCLTCSLPESLIWKMILNGQQNNIFVYDKLLFTMLINRWVIICTAPPPKLCHKSPPLRCRFKFFHESPLLHSCFTTYTEPFSRLICVFLEKYVTFLNLQCYIMFYRNCSKSQFYLLKSHFVSFCFQKTR